LIRRRTPLTTWFEAAWHVSSAKNGMSAKTLERTIGTSYQVAWMMLQRFRVAMVNADRNQLSGDVEVDETFVGYKEHGGKRGRGTTKSIVVIAVEIRQPKALDECGCVIFQTHLVKVFYHLCTKWLLPDLWYVPMDGAATTD